MIAETIKQARKNKGLTQSKLAELISEPGKRPKPSTISDIETGKTKFKTLEKIFDVLNLEIK
jgi:transcriptional regulator with XRE-family HTH domain